MDIFKGKEMNVAKRELNLFRDLIYNKFGIYYSEKKDYLLLNKLEKILRKKDYQNLNDFYNLIASGDKKSLEYLTHFITTNHTFFFREKDHFEILRKDIITRKIRNPLIWCAGCSTGEEVYSIIIELFENNIYDFTIMATDIDKDVLLLLKDGVYEIKKLEELNRITIKKYFSECANKPNHYKIKEHLKRNIIIKKINLVENIVFERSFDYIFCRNVMIYFDEEKRNKVLENLLKNLKNNGYLFVGHSESLLKNPFNIEQIYNSIYRKKM